MVKNIQISIAQNFPKIGGEGKLNIIFRFFLIFSAFFLLQSLPAQAQNEPPQLPLNFFSQNSNPFLQNSDSPNPASNYDPCVETSLYYEQILQSINQGQGDIISRLPTCFSLDRSLVLKAVLIDPLQFQYANEVLQEDELFVTRLLKISPEILQFASPEIRGSEEFMEKASYINRNALKYASWKLLDNKIYIKKMIEIDSYNYRFAASRLQEIKEFAAMAFEDNGMLLEFAPLKVKSDKELVKIAINSNNSAIEFADEKLQEDKELQELAKYKTSISEPEKLQAFFDENYFLKATKKNLDDTIGNQAKLFKKQQLISRNYITKWQDYIDYDKREHNQFGRQTKLVAADNRNYHIDWRKDFKKYKGAAEKIEKFFTNRQLPQNIIDNLSTTFLWKIKNKPSTIAFNLYLMRDSSDEVLGPDFVDITSMTAILQEHKGKWKMTIVEVILDSEIKVSPIFENGHRKYVLWDLYTNNEKDANPKIIFKIEDGLRTYFEMFEEQANGKYKAVFRSKDYN